MKKFIIKLALFLLPPVLLLGFPYIVLLKSGELALPSRVISLATKDKKNVLYGTAYGGYTKALKVAGTLAYQPEVLTLGDSRVLQFRTEFFKPGVKFYNAGLAVSNLSDYRTFLSFVPTSTQPKVLIVDINQLQFNQPNYVPADPTVVKLMSPPSLDDQANIFITSWTHVYKHLLQGKFTLAQVFKPQPPQTELLGLEAITQLKGFRNDGSYYDGEYVLGRAPMPEGFDFAAARQWISTGTNSFGYGQEVYPPAVSELDAFLAECQQRGIYVIGFVAPLPHQVYAQMKDSGNFGYFFKVPSTIQPLFKKYNFEFYDFSDLASLGASDNEATDAAHASEKAYLRLDLKMLQSGSILNKYSDEPLLAKELQNSINSLDVFPDKFTD
jgi:hypothetical protein